MSPLSTTRSSAFAFALAFFASSCAMSRTIPTSSAARTDSAATDAGTTDASHVVASSLDAATADGAVVDTRACPLEKLGFTRETGCRNDGSVELCLPVADATALERATAIAPKLRCMLGSRGRAGCDPTNEYLCLLSTDADSCVGDRRGALTDEAYARVCALAELPSVRKIVPTLYE